MMVRNFIRFHRAEGAQTHVQGDKSRFYPLGPDFIQQFLGKMETGCGRGGRPHLPGIHGLVPLLVRQLRLDVGRQGHFPQFLKDFQKDARIVKLYYPVSVLLNLPDRGGKLPVPKGDHTSRLHFPAGLYQTLPAFVPQVPQKQNLYHAAGGAVAQKPGWEYPGVVHHQAVPGIQIVDNIIKMIVTNRPALAVQHHQTGSVPPLQGCLGDQFLGQIIVKIMGLHTAFLHILVCSV